jgi:hypothetical protein
VSLAGAQFPAASDRLPWGPFGARHEEQHRVAVRSALGGGRADRLVAEAAGRREYVSIDLYRLAGGALRYPCEMAEDAARAFVLGAAVVGAMARRQ